MNFDEFDCGCILIPLLQRDYVQGNRKEIIGPFVDKLVASLKGEDDCNLNFIYGYNKDWNGAPAFVAIDGQQRLTTLWLLHLYLGSEKIKSLTLCYENRSYADDFVCSLKTHIRALINRRNDIETLSDEIKDSSWFISSWMDDTSVSSMMATLDVIHKKLRKEDLSKYKGHSDNVYFAFYSINGELDDDIYFKMNGRGRPLSEFEILKSELDENLPAQWLEEKKESWRKKIDGVWDDFFWNIKYDSEKSLVEIDESQRLFFCNLFKLHKIFRNQSDEKYGLDLYEFIESSLDKLCDLKSFAQNVLSELTGLRSFESLLFGENLSVAQQLVLYSILQTPSACCKERSFKDWMRLWRNLICNSDIHEGEAKSVLESIKKFSSLVDEDDFYEVLKNNVDKLEGFDARQLKEERQKAEFVIKNVNETSLIEKIFNLENCAKFVDDPLHGMVGFVFDCSEPIQSCLAGCLRIADSKIDYCIFRSALLTFPPHQTWVNVKQDKIQHFVNLKRDVLVPVSTSKSYNCFKALLAEYCRQDEIQNVNKWLENRVKSVNLDSSCMWTYYAKNPETWDKMPHKIAYNDGELLCGGKDRDNKSRSDLRSFSVFCDFKSKSKALRVKNVDGSNNKEDYWLMDGWIFNFYSEEHSCLFLDKKFKDADGLERRIAIDVFHRYHNSADDYTLQVFQRSFDESCENGDVEKQKLFSFFEKIGVKDGLGFEWSKNRFNLSLPKNYLDIQEEVERIMRLLNDKYEEVPFSYEMVETGE